MFALNLLFLVLLTISSGQSGVPQYIQGRWIIPEEKLQYDDIDLDFLATEEFIKPRSSVPVEIQSSTTAPKPLPVKEQDPTKEVEESAVWKIVLVAAVLLVSIVGSLSVAYYLCIWRGGRIYYQPQKQDFA